MTSIRRVTVRISLIGACVGAVIAVATWQAGAGSGDTSTPQMYPAPGDTPEEIVAELEQLNVEVASTDAVSDPPVSLEEATDLARAEFGFDKTVEARSASIEAVTTLAYGEERQLDPELPSDVAPAINDQPVWVVTFSDAPIPVMGRSGSGIPTSYAQGNFVVFVDTEVPQFLYALAF